MNMDKIKKKKLLSRLIKSRKNGELKNFIIKSPNLIPPVPDLRTSSDKKRDFEIQKKKEEDDAKVLIQEGRDRMFNMSFENQQWEHMWNLEEYEKNRIERYENEFPYDESYEGVAQWCICYKCRPEWHSECGGSIYKAKEENKEFWENRKMNKEDSERERKRLKLKEQDLNNRKLAKRTAKEQKKKIEKEENEKMEKEKLKKNFELQEMEYRKFLIKEKDQEREQLIKDQGWKKHISKKTNKVYWVKMQESKWDKEINVQYDEWLEFYSYNHDKQYWYNHKTKEKSWVRPNLDV